jgi:hypothetical protein
MAFHYYEDEFVELREIALRWKDLSRRTKDGILVLAGVENLPKEKGRLHPRARRGESPLWLPAALNILRDSEGQLTDTEIAQRVGVSQSTLSRSTHFRRAKAAYFQQTRKVVRKSQFKKQK